jgi:hypothetical protein
MSLTRRVLSVAGALALALGAASAGAPSSFADDGQISINQGSGWTHDGTQPLFDVSHVAPGWSSSAEIQVRDDSSGAASMAITSTDIADLENGCNRPESLVDKTCGADEGELGHEIRLSIYVDPDNDGTYEAQPKWTGTVYDLLRPAVLDDEVIAHDVVAIRVIATLPITSGNEIQTDQVRFGLRLDLAGDTARVLGTRVSRHQHPNGVVRAVVGALPLTGSSVARLFAGSVWMIAGGSLLLLLARTCRRRPGSSATVRAD